MFHHLIFRSIPYFFVVFFIFLEFTPNYFFESQVIKPYMFYTVLYCWIIHDFKKFSIVWILIFCTFYDLIQQEIVGITSIFFLIINYLQRKEFNDLISLEFKEAWIKFILSLTMYLCVFSFASLFSVNNTLALKTITISFVLSVMIFPLFFSVIEKLSRKFKS
jgi:rod shape-determining protein MreD